MSEVRGYKVFNPDWTCSPNGNTKQYACPGKFEEDIIPAQCDGMHFCKKAADCFNYYSFKTENKVAEVIAYGDIVEEGDKCCTNKLEIVREIPWQELLEIVNTGKECTGCNNSGNWNSGNRNSGNWNSGDCNSGNRNSGDCNSGNRNSGNWNSGNWNSGNCNSGNWNSGDCNSGNRNSGDWNSGDWNKCSHSAGVFCTETPKLIMFNKLTDMTFKEWEKSPACILLDRIDSGPTIWVQIEKMTDEEKEEHPEHETCGGYLKQTDISERCNAWWMSLTTDERCIIQDMPGFDPDIFFEITGIRVQ